MPTMRARHAITETPEIADALVKAAARWPEDRDRPAVLLRHLIETGADAIAALDDEDAHHRAAAALIDEHRASIGIMTVGVPPDAGPLLAEVRASGIKLPGYCLLLTAKATGGATATFVSAPTA